MCLWYVSIYTHSPHYQRAAFTPEILWQTETVSGFSNGVYIPNLNHCLLHHDLKKKKNSSVRGDEEVVTSEIWPVLWNVRQTALSTGSRFQREKPLPKFWCDVIGHPNETIKKRSNLLHNFLFTLRTFAAIVYSSIEFNRLKKELLVCKDF